MFCKNCGAELINGAKFCAECGAEIIYDEEMQKGQESKVEINNQEEPVSEPVKETTTVEEETTKKKHSIAKIIIGVAALVAAIAVVIGISVTADKNADVTTEVLYEVAKNSASECYDSNFDELQEILDTTYSNLDWLIEVPDLEKGDIKLLTPEENPLNTGYYLVEINVPFYLYNDDAEDVGFGHLTVQGDIRITDSDGNYEIMNLRISGPYETMYNGRDYSPTYDYNSSNSISSGDGGLSSPGETDNSYSYSGYNSFDQFAGEYQLESEYNVKVIVEDMLDNNHLTFYYYVNDTFWGEVYAYQVYEETWEGDAQFCAESVESDDSWYYRYLSEAVFMINSRGFLTIESGVYGYDCLYKVQ